jgi:di/tricarboxylate transporter
MTWEQGLIVVILLGTMACLVWDRWRYDIVALAALLLCVLTGLVPAGAAFQGFSNPAVITVVGVLMMSTALAKSGIVGVLAGRFVTVRDNRRVHLAGFCLLALALSAFMNNVAALALLMPVLLSTARRFGYPASFLLMPVSFATLLGGMITMVGTPPNLLISNFRQEVTGMPFSVFDFLPVGLSLAVLGGLYLIIARRLPVTEDDDGEEAHDDDIFDVADYVTEARIRSTSPLVGLTVGAVEARWPVTLVGVVRNERRLFGHLSAKALRADDILLLQAGTRGLEALVNEGLLELVERGEAAAGDDLHVMEAVVTPNAVVLGSTPSSLDLRQRFGVTLLAAARQGRRFEGRLGDANLNVGDVILLEGPPARTRQTIRALGCLPLAQRSLKFSGRRTMLPIIIFAGAVALAASGILAIPVAFIAGVLVMILTGLLKPSEAFEGVNWSVIVLLGAMIPVGGALGTTGAAAVIAQGFLANMGEAGPMVMLAATLLATMAITPVLNNATTVILMAPIVVGISSDLGASPDPFLMAIAVGASTDFLTPFGHHNNAIILGPGGYRMRDYLKLGLPLSALVAAASMLIIPVVWPF